MARPKLIIPYDPEFLGDGFSVPLPVLKPDTRTSALADGAVLDYTHFSLVMNEERRTAQFTAHNIDAERNVRGIGGGLTWQMDERAGAAQLGPEVYAHNVWDKGHLVRREDVVWGTRNEASLANEATFFFTNSAPQHENFNQDEWVKLEDWVLYKAVDFSYRLCVFTGPVLSPDDPRLSELPPDVRAGFRAVPEAQIPAAFWKVIVLRDATAGGDDLAVVAFAMRQTEMWSDRNGRKLLKLKTHQVTLDVIEEWSGLDFGDLKLADELQGSEERVRARTASLEAPWPVIQRPEDIVWSGPQRRARGLRAIPRAATVRRLPAYPDDTARSNGCRCGEHSFDAQAAVAALSRDIEALADAISLSAGQQERSSSSSDGTRSLASEGTESTATPAVDEQRVRETLERTPEPLRPQMETFVRTIAEDAAAYRAGAVPQRLARLTERIVGGTRVSPGGFLSTACLGNPEQWLCTGVLVLPDVLLTAAHCGAITRVLLGAVQLPPFDPSGKVYPVRRTILHPEYKRPRHDIAIVILDRPAAFPPIRLARPAELAAAESMELVGFGFNDPERPVGFGTKRRVNVPIGPIDLGDGRDLSSLQALFGFFADHEFVAGRKGLGRDTCNGDSGGPAYIPLGDGTYALAGLTSRATREAVVSCGDGGIYVRPDTYLDWINEELERAGVAGRLSV